MTGPQLRHLVALDDPSGDGRQRSGEETVVATEPSETVEELLHE